MFLPPQDNPVLRRVFHALFPYVAHVVGRLRNVELAEADLARLQGLGDSRAILTPNHPTVADPLVMMWVSRLVREPFQYLAAREILEGLTGRVLNQLGAYSVVRGTPDRESIRMTRRLLGELNRKVVIFPEGEIYQHNDRLLDFQTGVAQIGFWVLEDLEKRGVVPALPVTPVAIKYRCCESPRPAIENSLRDLEAALKLAAPRGLTSYTRLLRVGEEVLATLEAQEGICVGDPQDLTRRIQGVRRAVLRRVAHAVGEELDETQPPAEQLHGMFNKLKSWVGFLPDDYSPYDERLHTYRVASAEPLFRDLYRLQNCIVMTGTYLAEEHTAERFLDVLGRLEQEVLGRVRHPVAREAVVRVAAPLRLEARLSDYRSNRRQTVMDVTQELEGSIRTMLLELAQFATPISLED